MLDPPINTRVFPISGMIFIGEWRYPPTYFRDRFPIYVIFFFGRHPLAKVDGRGAPKKFMGRHVSRTPLAILGPPNSHFGFCRRCGVASRERVTPAPLGWYYYYFFFKPSLINIKYFAMILGGIKTMNILITEFGKVHYIF